MSKKRQGSKVPKDWRLKWARQELWDASETPVHSLLSSDGEDVVGKARLLDDRSEVWLVRDENGPDEIEIWSRDGLGANWSLGQVLEPGEE